MFKKITIAVIILLILTGCASGLITYVSSRTENEDIVQNTESKIEETQRDVLHKENYETAYEDILVPYAKKSDIPFEKIESKEEVVQEVKESPVKKTEPKPASPPQPVKPKPIVTTPQAPAAGTPKPEVSEPSAPSPEQTEEEKKEEVEEVKPAYVVDESFAPTAAIWAQEILVMVNEARAAAGVKPLKYNKSLGKGAMVRAVDSLELFSHTRPDGTQFFTAFGPNFQYRSIGENLARGFRSGPEAAMEGWMNSEGHRNNILASKYEEFAMAIIPGLYGRYHWVQIFYTKP